MADKNNQEYKRKLIKKVDLDVFYRELKEEEQKQERQNSRLRKKSDSYNCPMLIGVEFDVKIFDNHTGEPVKTSNRTNEFDSEITVHVSANQLKDGLINGFEAESKRLTGVQKCVAFSVLMVIASYMDIEGKSFPSLQTIADQTGLSIATTFKTIENLQDIKIAGKPILTVAKKDRSVNVYTVTQGIFKN